MARAPSVDLATWPALTLEGNLIAPAMVARVDRREAPEQSEADYGVRKGLTIREEISLAFRVGQAHYDHFTRTEHPGYGATLRFVQAFVTETLGFNDLEAGEHPVSLQAGESRIPIVVVPPEEALDRRSATLSSDRSRAPSFSLQDDLNSRDDALWGLVTNGTRWRLMRDNASLTRPAFVEVDLAQVFTTEDIASFAIVWLLLHRSRFGRAGTPSTDCALERWRDAGSREGEAARDRLSAQVEEALRVLGTGFLTANPALAERLQDGRLDRTVWFNELLRLVYRLIFLMVAEDRELLHPPDATLEARQLYVQGYSLLHLRAQAVRRASWDRYHDRYEGLKVVFRALADGESRLGLPALGGLFRLETLDELMHARLSNRACMEALRRLSWLSSQRGMVPINWRAMETEELGSVYESLLELQPQLSEQGKALRFASDLAERKGSQRKTTGSYYTPDSLVQALLDTALDPVLDRTEAEADDPEAALLKLSVIDPACGSGHFLLAAARRIATRVARIRAEGTPSLADFRHALRDVARSCLYGVDRNPMAVELTKVALWIETVDPGRPLGFFDAQIRCGDSLLGVFDLKALEDGIPDAAYTPLIGDDKNTAKYYLRLNRDAKAGQGVFDLAEGTETMPAIRPLVAGFSTFRDLPEDTVEQISTKADRFTQLRADRAFIRAQAAADLFVAAFLLPKTGSPSSGTVAPFIPTTHEIWRSFVDDLLPSRMQDAQVAAQRVRAFHWPLEFPDVMARGGFNVVLGNPPWERVKLQEQEFFALRDHQIATAKNAAARKKLIAELTEANPNLFQEWHSALRVAASESHFMRESGRFPFGGVGDVNTYAAFTDLFWQLTNTVGYAGLIIPIGLVNGFTYRDFLGALLKSNSLVSFYGFENEDLLFPHITNKVKFGLLTIAGREVQVEQPWFTAHIRQPSEIPNPKKRYALTIDEIRAINPNTLNLPAFRWAKDAEITAAIHMGAAVLIEKNGTAVVQNAWSVRFKTMFHMANDSESFIDHRAVASAIRERRGAMAILEDGRRVYPLYEGKMFWHFDHRYGTYEGQTEKQANKGVLPRVGDDQHDNPEYRIEPRYWVDSQLTQKVLDVDGSREWFYAWRDVGPSERTFVGTVVPKTALGHTSPILVSEAPAEEVLALFAILSSLVVDYALRQKSSRMTFFVIEQLPMLSPDVVRSHVGWMGAPVAQWLNTRALELYYTNWEIVGLARSVGNGHPPYNWMPNRRAILQAEIDAAVLHLYGLDRIQSEWIIDSFTVLRKYEERDYGEFRTKRLVLEAYDGMAAAAEAGLSYQTSLQPPPADVRCCQPNSGVGPVPL